MIHHILGLLKAKVAINLGGLLIAILTINSGEAMAQATVQLFDSKEKRALSELVPLGIKTPATVRCSGNKDRRDRYVFVANAPLPASQLSIRARTGRVSCGVELPVAGTLSISKKPKTSVPFIGTLIRRVKSEKGEVLYDGILVDSRKGRSRQPLVIHIVGVRVEERR